MNERVLDGYACTECHAEPERMVPAGFGERGQLFRCADGCGPRIECKLCAATFEGDRTEARRAHWEPFSTSTQHDLDHGPMVCTDCIGHLLEGLLDAMRKAPASAWTGAHL
ncbi:hypothetical protein [Glaciibacter psychrotolerans]|uniref:Uncharacterized protein n=1 Tax=Glaciibacter psychrotolerans TaxID=670054 RepID=A0A7Z0J6R2_9MICO|nr:hypothetical protein [Leifsonia psychrotolerans]NYJ20797.1 hypothetical protein [Leifsonia psychrotolerans]